MTILRVVMQEIKENLLGAFIVSPKRSHTKFFLTPNTETVFV